MSPSVRPDKEETLLEAIRSTPIIDNHAHPLVKLESIDLYPFLSIATEAHGDAIQASRTSLAHHRAVNILSRALQCDSTWDSVVAAINEKRANDYEAWVSRCLSGIENVLVDDGLDSESKVEPYTYFDRFTRSASKRIVRIEHVAARLMREACATHESPAEAFDGFLLEFIPMMAQAINDPEVVGFKSVICYRTGLDIRRKADPVKAAASFTQIFHQQSANQAELPRIDHPGLNEFLVHQVVSMIRDTDANDKKPIQFHTGLGDNDITLNKSSPAELQEFIREYPTVPIVLLHSGYPFARETGYLAAMYANVYADIGEVFPFLSRDGQTGVVRQILELCPGSKILWSTDGHWFPETYLLAVEQMREVLQSVLLDYVRKGDLTWLQATELVEDMLFNNSNRLYNLGLALRPLESRQSLALPHHGNKAASNSLMDVHHTIHFLRFYWLDMTATPRARAFPIRRARNMLQEGGDFSLGITKSSLGLMQNDMPAPGVTPTGEYRLHPDWTTLRQGPREGHAMVMGTFKEQNGSDVDLCPRTALRKALDTAASAGLQFILGFEIELVLMRRTKGSEMYQTLDWDGHAWCVSRAMNHEVNAEIIEEAVARLEEEGIYIDMIHPESAPGQYEVVMPRAPALEAVDNLVYAREVIQSCAAAKGYKMTLHPKPVPHAAGSASHVHISLSNPSGSDPEIYEAFYAGILEHLRGICAFTYSGIASYERVQDGCWAGGTWVAWGTQNRETPLRKIKDSHWEVKCMDGLANPYLALAALLLAGTRGVESGCALEMGDCEKDPAFLSASEQRELGITKRLPRTLEEALTALKEDTELCGSIGVELVERYSCVKEAEIEMLAGKSQDEQRRWFIERY